MNTKKYLIFTVLFIGSSIFLLTGCSTKSKDKMHPNTLRHSGQYIAENLSVGERNLYAVDTINKNGQYIMLEQGGTLIINEDDRSMVKEWDDIDRLLVIRTSNTTYPYKLVNTTYLETVSGKIL